MAGAGAVRALGELVAGGAVRAAGAMKVVPPDSPDGTGVDGRATGVAGRGVTPDWVELGVEPRVEPGGVDTAGTAGAAGAAAATDGRPGVPPGRPG
ncbi:MAG TPA: hypothetical protein VIC62_16310 [Nakamurella sp.]